MKGIRKNSYRFFIYVYTIFRMIIKNYFPGSSKNKGSNSVLIISAQHLGESVLFVDCMNRIVDEYKNKKGINVSFIGNKSTIELYKKYLQCQPSDYIAIDKYWNVEGDNHKFTDFIHFLKIVDKKRYETVIIPFDSITCMLITGCICSRFQYALTDPKIGYRDANPLLRWIWHNYANQRVLYNEFDNMYVRYSELMKAIGITDYISRIGRLKISPSKSIDNPYFVLVPGAMEDARRWEPDKYVELVRYIVEKQHIACIIVGTTNEQTIGCYIENRIHELHKNVRVINMTGKTEIHELINVLSGAEFIIGNDTGTIHIGAALGIQTFAITTYKDPEVYLPYKVDKLRDDDKLPVVLRLAEVPECMGCHLYTIGGVSQKMKRLNENCYKSVIKGGPYYCIGKLSVEETENTISEFLNNKRLDR